LLSVRLAEGVGENVETLVGLSEHCWGFRVATVKLVVVELLVGWACYVAFDLVFLVVGHPLVVVVHVEVCVVAW